MNSTDNESDCDEKRRDRMFNNLYNERRITRRLLKMDRALTIDYLTMVSDNSYKREKR